MVLLEELVEDILLRLAVEDLLRYQIVCKSWYSLISSHRFAKSHLKHTRNSSNTNKDLGHVRIVMPTYWKVPNESLFHYNSWTVVGSSNGLVCFSPLPQGALILLNNPLTREHRKVPFVMPENTSMEEICLGFGYDSSTDDYKVVLGISKASTEETLIQVLSLKSNTWKLIGVVKYRIYHNVPGILFDDALHWIAIDYNDNKENTVILSFDLSREEFTVISEPSDSKYECCLYDNQFTYLGIVEDQLCIYFGNRGDDIC